MWRRAEGRRAWVHRLAATAGVHSASGLSVLCVSALGTPPPRRTSAQTHGFLQEQAGPHDHRARGGERLRPRRTFPRPLPAKAHPGTADHRRPEHAGGGERRRRQFPLRAGTPGRDRARLVLAQCAEPGAHGAGERRSRPPTLQLARRHIASGAGLHPHGDSSGERPRRSLHPGVHRGRCRCRLLAQHSAHRVQPRARNQVPGGRRLSGHDRPGASRGTR